MDFVVTRAPFRISFAGGGTDLPAFYEETDGAVVSATIDKYVYVTINKCRPLFAQGIDDHVRYRIRLSYSSTENVQNVDDLRHPIVREAIKLVGLDTPMDIATMADVPAGNGLGSSGTFSVALLHALHLLKGEKPKPDQLASEAADIEINRLGRPVGKQDHYAAAFGGLNLIKFKSDGTVQVTGLDQQRPSTKHLFSNLMLLHTGVSRDSSSVLTEQRANVRKMSIALTHMRDQAHAVGRLLSSTYNPQRFGDVLHDNWMRKRNLATNISSSSIDKWYETALQAGALGGKICGAGGGGFLLLYVEPPHRSNVLRALSNLTELSIGYEPSGSKALIS